MFKLPRYLARPRRPISSAFFSPRPRPGAQYKYSSSSSSKPPTPTPQSRADRILSRLPASLQKYTTRLRSAPVSHVVAFLVLHELTAVVPLLALFGLFHYTDFVPLGYMTEHYGSYVRDGVGRFERYFRRKGWFGFGREDDGEAGGGQAVVPDEQGDEAIMNRWESADGKYRIVVEIALAYSITKVLLPVRIVGSLWATPWFAVLLARIRRIVPMGKK